MGRAGGSGSVYKVPNNDYYNKSWTMKVNSAWFIFDLCGWWWDGCMNERKSPQQRKSAITSKKGTYSLHDNDFCLSGDASLDRENWIAIPRLCYLLSHKCIILSLSPIMGLGIYHVYMALQTDMCMNALVHLLSRCTSKICAWKTQLRSSPEAKRSVEKVQMIWW